MHLRGAALIAAPLFSALCGGATRYATDNVWWVTCLRCLALAPAQLHLDLEPEIAPYFTLDNADESVMIKPVVQPNTTEEK